ncbi:MAG: hypothetical protein HPY89_01960 [Pelotomaculum sp.]|nr:hypothetical protein [Pelotomaculum sp.]
MKIGAGGLQAQVMQEAARMPDTSRLKPPVEEALLQGEDLAMRRLAGELNRAVELMRKAAELYHKPLEFSVRRGDRPRIRMRDRRTGAERELTLEEALAWLDELRENRGRNLNGYA